MHAVLVLEIFQLNEIRNLKSKVQRDQYIALPGHRSQLACTCKLHPEFPPFTFGKRVRHIYVSKCSTQLHAPFKAHQHALITHKQKTTKTKAKQTEQQLSPPT